MYLNWLPLDMTEENAGFAADQVASCDTMRNIFNTKSSDPNSRFRDNTPAQALANTISCYGGSLCPSFDCLSKFFIREESINKSKENVLGEMRRDADFKMLTCDKKDWRANLAKLSTLSAVFQYIDHREVATVFITINNRMRDVLKALDADLFYARIKPAALKVSDEEEIPHNGWLGAYDYFMRMFLDGTQEKSRQYASKCVKIVLGQIDGDASLDPKERSREVAMLIANLGWGMWRDEVLISGPEYAGLIGTMWT